MDSPRIGRHLAVTARGEESPLNVRIFAEVAERVQPGVSKKLEIAQKFPGDKCCTNGRGSIPRGRGMDITYICATRNEGEDPPIMWHLQPHQILGTVFWHSPHLRTRQWSVSPLRKMMWESPLKGPEICQKVSQSVNFK